MVVTNFRYRVHVWNFRWGNLESIRWAPKGVSVEVRSHRQPWPGTWRDPAVLLCFCPTRGERIHSSWWYFYGRRGDYQNKTLRIQPLPAVNFLERNMQQVLDEVRTSSQLFFRNWVLRIAKILCCEILSLSLSIVRLKNHCSLEGRMRAFGYLLTL